MNHRRIAGWLATGLLGASLALPAAEAPVYWAAPGNGGTWDTRSTQWGAPKAETTFTPGQDVVFGGQGGTVALGEDLTVGKLTFATPGYTLAPGEKVLTIKEGIAGRDYTVRFDGRKGGLRFPNGGEFAGTTTGTGLTNLWVDGGVFTFSGFWQVAGGPQASSFLRLSNGATAVIAPQAQINNQMPDFIYARVLFIYGVDGRERIEFQPGFKADYMGFPDLAAWHPNGYSVLFLGDMTLVTNDTQGLPTVHKRSGNGNHTHHGVIDFHKGTKNTWLVTGATQYYDGVVGARSNLTLRTEKDLLLTGAYFEDSHCYFGADADEPVQLVKEGPATLALMCTQLYAPGSTMQVKEGTVAFHSDPADAGQYFRATSPNSKRIGANLQLQVAQGATATFESAPGSTIASLTTDGAVTVARLPLTIAGDCTSTEHAAWDVRFAVTVGARLPAAAVTVGGKLTQAGTLVVTPPANARPGTYQVFAAKEYAGDFALQLPAGYQGTYKDGVLTLTAVPAR